jgi:OmpA-OmpF porin, OOP family
MTQSLRSLIAGSATAIALAAVGPAIAQDSVLTSPTVTADLQQEQAPPADLSGLTPGPDIEGIITARTGERIQISGADSSRTVLLVSDSTQVRGRGGFLGLDRRTIQTAQLVNGLPVTVETVQWGDTLIARRINLRNNDLRVATMIRDGTEQGFAEQTAATEALRNRVANIDQYNIRGTTNVYFDTGRFQLTPEAQAQLCAAAQQAQSIDNALLLVVGYTDEVGSEENNQILSERRAGRVVNHLQQRCRWAPYRMLTPSGMAESDPAADNSTPEGRAQNRRVQVSILVSKAVDGI